MNRFFEQLQGSNLSPFDILLLVLYASTSLGIGLYASRRKTDSDFMIAGRRIGIIGFVTSVVASYMGINSVNSAGLSSSTPFRIGFISSLTSAQACFRPSSF